MDWDGVSVGIFVHISEAKRNDFSFSKQERAEEMAQWLKAYTGPADDPS